MTDRVTYSSKSRRTISESLPESVATACVRFIGGVLAEEPHRVGKPLRAPLEGLYSARRGAFRVVYRIDDGKVMVLIVTIEHRRDVYRS